MSENLDADSAEIWPYPIRYGQVKRHESDVVILGGGIAGVWAAIGAARQGAKVVLVETVVQEEALLLPCTFTTMEQTA